MIRTPKFLPVLLLTTLTACHFPNPFGGEKVLAEAGEEVLYERDVAPIFTPEMSPADSVVILKSYVDQWVKKQLKVQEGERLFHSSQEDIDKLVEDYRNSLLTYKVDQYYVERFMDTVFTDDQVRDYYEKNLGDFVLDKTIVRARMIRFPEGYSQTRTIKELMMSAREQDYQDLVELSAKNGFQFVDLTQWSDFSVLLDMLPVNPDADYDYILKEGKIYEFSTQDSQFFVRTMASRSPGDYAPLESVAEVIRRVLYNNRREALIRNHEDSLYRKALADRKIIVNVK